MRKKVIFVVFCLVWCVTVTVQAQQHGWAQYSFSGGYENFAHTYEKSGYMFTADVEAHGRRKIFGAFLVGMSAYEGLQPVWVDYGKERISDNISDRRTQIIFAAGPGFDFLSNHIDRCYLSLYGGYAIVNYEYDYFNAKVREFRDESRNGLTGLMRLGYEHQCGRSWAIGAFLQGAYIGEELNWAVGVRIGFRTSDFHTKRLPATY